MELKINNYYNFITIALFFITSQIMAQDPFNSPTVLPGSDANMSLAVALGDYNNDGWVDLYLTKGNDKDGSSYLNYIFKNSSGSFVKQNIPGITDINLTSGTASWADINNDGYIDLYVANAQNGSGGSKPDNNLFLNDGTGSFIDKTGNSTTGTIVTDNEDSRYVGWGDYNNDGYPDVFVDNGNITFFGPTKGINSFYSNDGDGTFTKKSSSDIGDIVSSSNNDYKTFGSGFGWSDFNNDGYLDIYNTSGGGPKNILWKNNTTGKFVDVTPGELQPVQTEFMGVSWVDFDNDGDMDIFTDNTISGVKWHNYMFQNNSTVSTVDFDSLTNLGSIVTDRFETVGSAWGDIDNDGDLDVFVSNRPDNNQTSIPSILYINDGLASGYTFTRAHDYFYPGSSDNFEGRGVAMADFNNDGFLDLVSSRNGDPLYFENKANNGNKYMLIKLIGIGTTNRSAIGSRIKVTANIPEQNGTITQMREVMGVTGGGGQNSLRQHFGLGTTSKIDEVKTEWLNSSGSSARDINTMTDLPTNKIIIFTQGNLSASASVTKEQNFMYLFGNTKAAIEFTSNTDTDGGTLTVQKIESDPGGTFNSGSATSPNGTTITANKVVNDRYWTITESGLTGNFTSTVYLDANNLPTGITIDDIVILKRNNSGSDWTPLNTSKIGNTVYASGITSFSEFAFGYESVILDVKIFLEGPYNGTDMNITLNSEIPETSPYGEDPRTVSPIPADVVDWVLVELRKDANGTAVKSKSVFLYKNGKLVNDNASVEEVQMDIPKGDYFIVIKHRNHLAVMSANTVSLSGTANLYDFTTGSGQFYGLNGAKQIGN